MSGDYSRYRFDPWLDFAGVLMQQGRVQLDADWNEQADLLDRRLRAEGVDIFGLDPTPGISGVAVVSPQTPTAFRIEAVGGTIRIGRGRMYVNGLLAENHGRGNPELDPVLAELRGQDPLDYSPQPYHPDPPTLPSGGPHLVYLDVWQRELTHRQRPELVEKAVALDTTNRIQTVWQVRLLANVSSVDCTTPDAQIPGWQALIAPSAGRLSSRAMGVDPAQDPCELPPGGGYRGLENQLYRVEIHDGGTAQATFNWSRDNASVTASVEKIVSTTELELDSLGRDQVLRFNSGDWVEILDDWRELSGEGGDPALRRGEMRKITVNEAAESISFSPALPGDLIPGGSGDDTLEKRHLRVRRWDQKGKVRDAGGNLIVDLHQPGSTGTIPVPAAGTWVVLENGVQVQFDLDPAGDVFRSGDFWSFAARTADTSVEELDRAPPRGIHHHFARLALVTFPDSETDCRRPWKVGAGGGCCTFSVAPGESIQAAIDALPFEGGCVCLKTGLHRISDTIRIDRSRVVLRGESPGTQVRSTGLQVTLQIGSDNSKVTDVLVTGIRFEAAAGGQSDGAVAWLSRCNRVRLEHCGFEVMPHGLPVYVGIWMDEVADVQIAHNRLRGAVYGIFVDDFAGRLDITDNQIEGPTGLVFGNDRGSLGQLGVLMRSDTAAGCRIANNRIDDYWIGIALQRGAEGSQVIDNRIGRSAATASENLPTDLPTLRQYLDNRFYAIHLEATRCAVKGNHIDLASSIWGGILVDAADVSVAGNRLTAASVSAGAPVPGGIYCRASATQGDAADRVTISGNRLQGPQAGIVVARIDEATVAGNRVDGDGAGWYGVLIDDCTDTRVQDNQIEEVFFAVHLADGERNQVAGNRIGQSGQGITSARETDLKVNGNRLYGCLQNGIFLLIRDAAAVVDNRVVNCSYAAFNLSLGISVIAEQLYTPPGTLTRIEGCEVIDTGIAPAGQSATNLDAVAIGAWVPACQVTDNRTDCTQPALLSANREHRALSLIGPVAFRYIFGSGVLESMYGSALIAGNHFRGPGRTSLVELVHLQINQWADYRFEKVTFNNHVCEHLNPTANESGATVMLRGGHLIAMGNHVKALAQGVNSMSLGRRDKVSLMGNVTTGGYINVGTVTPTPIANFNVRI